MSDLSSTFTSESQSKQPIRERIGFNIEGKDAADAVKRIREAENAGVRQVWMTVGGAGRGETLTTYAASAVQSEKIRLGTAIARVYPCHPLLIASQAIVINDLAPGRFRLGVGLSHRDENLQMYGYQMTSPLSYLKEYVKIVRDALHTGTVDFHGKFFNVTASMPRKAQLPVLVSALRENAFRAAGEVSDGAISWLCPVPYLLNTAIPALKEGALKSGRSTPPLVAQVLVAITQERSKALAAAKRRLSFYAKKQFYANMFAAAGLSVPSDGSVTDELAEALIIFGSENEISERLSSLLKNGLDELLVTLAPVESEEKERVNLLRMIGSM